MIGSQAYYEYLAGTRADLSLNGVASMPVDDAYGPQEPQLQAK